MFEYGRSVGEGTGNVPGSQGGGLGGSGGGDWGATIVQIGVDTAHNISTMPPAQLLLLVVVSVVGLIILRRAF